MKIQSILETIKEKYLGKEIELYKNKDSVGYYISSTKGIFEHEPIKLTVVDVLCIKYEDDVYEFVLTVNWNDKNHYISLYTT